MAHLLSSERPTAAAYSTSLFAGFFAWAGKVRAQRTRRVALSSLLELDEHLLTDLGLSRSDVVEAIKHPTVAGQKLHARRATRAAAIPSNAVSATLFDCC